LRSVPTRWLARRLGRRRKSEVMDTSRSISGVRVVRRVRLLDRTHGNRTLPHVPQPAVARRRQPDTGTPQAPGKIIDGSPSSSIPGAITSRPREQRSTYTAMRGWSAVPSHVGPSIPDVSKCGRTRLRAAPQSVRTTSSIRITTWREGCPPSKMTTLSCMEPVSESVQGERYAQDRHRASGCPRE